MPGTGTGSRGRRATRTPTTRKKRATIARVLRAAICARTDSTMRKTFDVRRGRSRANSEKQKAASIVTRSARGTRIIVSLKWLIEGEKYQYWIVARAERTTKDASAN